MTAEIKPGIYARDALDYAAIPAINQSLLKWIGKSPLHFKHRQTSPQKTSELMRLGSVAHTATLEPHRLARDFAVWDQIPTPKKPSQIRAPSTKEKKPRRAGGEYEAFCAMNAGKEILKPEQLEAGLRVAEAVRGNQLAMRYLARGKAEQVLVWRDEKTGLLCKARLDWLSESVPDVMLELKTSGDVSPWAFSGKFAKLGHHIQCAFYRRGYKTITGRELYAKCAAVESAEPHDVIVYDLAEVIDVGDHYVGELLEKLDHCNQSGLWLGQSPSSEQTLQLPKWLDPEEDDGNALDDIGLVGFQ